MAKAEPEESKFNVDRSILPQGDISANVFSALYWLRRGTGDTDPIESFPALMVSLQILARELIPATSKELSCPQCGGVVSKCPSGDTKLVRSLLVDRLGISKEKARELWGLRSAVVAHGGKAVSADVILKLTEAKFDVADLVFKAVGETFGLKEGSAPTPRRSFNVTDAFMNVV